MPIQNLHTYIVLTAHTFSCQCQLSTSSYNKLSMLCLKGVKFLLCQCLPKHWLLTRAVWKLYKLTFVPICMHECYTSSNESNVEAVESGFCAKWCVWVLY